MGEKIAIGIHAVVDWECKWNADVFCELAERYDIKEDEIASLNRIHSERDLMISILDFMRRGMGCELFPETNDIVETFAANFSYHTTIGGTGARAAIAISKLGYSSVLQTSSSNSIIYELLPCNINAIAAKPDSSEEIYPHVSITYPKGAHIKTRELDFITPRENRVLISCDSESFDMSILENFSDYCKDAKVFLLSSFCEILDPDIMKEKMQKCRNMLEKMDSGLLIILEDACYINQELRRYVNDQLYPYLDIISMNEDELQDFIGKRFDILNPELVFSALEETYKKMRVPTIFVHSSSWAIAYGENHEKYGSALLTGITMASTRFRYGDHYGWNEFNETKQIMPSEKGVQFAQRIEAISDKLTCIPCKDMGFVQNPTAVGLGDAFAGGLLIDLSERDKFW